MNIALLGLNYAPEMTGNAPYTTGLASGLTQRGHSVRVLSGYPHYPSWTLDSRYKGWSFKEEIDGVYVRRLRHYVPSKANLPGRALLEATYGARLLTARWGRPDVVLCVSPALIASALAIARNRLTVKRPPVGVLVQDLYSLGMAETESVGAGGFEVARRFESLVLRSADGIAVVHEKFKHTASTQLRIPENRIKVIRNWTHLQGSHSTVRTQTRLRLGWRETDIVVLHAGNMGIKQGLENVVRAAKLADSAPDRRVIFVLMGGGNQRRLLEANSAGIRSIAFIDPLPDEQFQETLAAADILLVNERPGVAEMSVPSKLTSYFKTGLPVLAASSPGGTTAHELGRSGGGIVIDPGDPQLLLERAALLGRNSELSRALGEAGRRYCTEYLGSDHAIDQYESWLRSLVDQSGNRRRR